MNHLSNKLFFFSYIYNLPPPPIKSINTPLYCVLYYYISPPVILLSTNSEQVTQDINKK